MYVYSGNVIIFFSFVAFLLVAVLFACATIIENKHEYNITNRFE